MVKYIYIPTLFKFSRRLSYREFTLLLPFFQPSFRKLEKTLLNTKFLVLNLFSVFWDFSLANIIHFGEGGLSPSNVVEKVKEIVFSVFLFNFLFFSKAWHTLTNLGDSSVDGEFIYSLHIKFSFFYVNIAENSAFFPILIYQPLCLGRIRHKVNILSEV